MRYTECRLSPFGELMLRDVEKLADFKDNFDNSAKEPVTLTSYWPELLCNPQQGIASGLATKFAPHYAKDVYTAILKVIKDEIKGEDTPIDSIIDIIKAPDFPTGGTIINGADVRKIYKTGTGPVTIRSKYRIENNSIIYYEIPYKVTPKSIIQSIAELEIPDIKDVRDETSLSGIRIVVELKKDANSEWIINKLFRDTALQSNYSINMTAILNNRPVQNLDIKQLIRYYLEKLCTVHEKSINIEIDELNRKIFINNTMLKAINLIDDIVKIVRNEENPIEKMIETLGFTKEEAEYIFNIKLSSISKASYDDLKVKEENYKNEKVRLETILLNSSNFLNDLYNKLKEIRDSKLLKNDVRRTEITNIQSKDTDDAKLFYKNEPVVITYSNKGMIKAVSPEEYKAARRNAKGVKNKLRDDEYILQSICMNTHDDLFLVSDFGRVYILPAYKIPISSRTGASKSINNYITLSENESILMVTKVPTEIEDQSVVFVTIGGLIKRIKLDLLVRGAKTSIGTKAVTLRDGDRICGVNICKPNTNIAIFTSQGRGVKFNIDDETKPVKCTGKTSMGVIAIRLKDEEKVVSASRIETNGSIVLITSQGFGKKLDVKTFKNGKRSQSPINYMSKIDKVGLIVGGIVVLEDEDLLITTKQGQVARINTVNEISESSRTASGIKMINLNDNDIVVSLATLKQEKKEEENDDGNE